jgi:hypothetical protein
VRRLASCVGASASSANEPVASEGSERFMRDYRGDGWQGRAADAAHGDSLTCISARARHRRRDRVPILRSGVGRFDDAGFRE